jgi:glutaredoxin
MSDKILFSLENCTKCNQTKQLLPEDTDVKIIQLPHDYMNWSDEEKQTVESYDVLEDLQRTAPILFVDGAKYIGYLRIKKWIQDNE